jgi:hypothetical protein
MSFQDTTLYSYSTPIARLVTDPRGERVALITSHSYSPTTSGRHMPAAYGAVSHLPHYRVPALGTSGGLHDEPRGDMHAANAAYLAKEYAAFVAKRMREQERGAWRDDHLRTLAQRVADYVQRFDVRMPGTIDTAADLARINARHDRLDAMRADPKYAGKREAEREKRAARKAAKEQRARELAAASAAEKLAAWRAGELSILPYDVRGGYGQSAALRVRGNVVQTSMGAAVPVADARRAVLFVAGVREAGKSWQRNGQTFNVGAFQLDAINANGDVKAGCHFIEWSEVARLAAALGVQS